MNRCGLLAGLLAYFLKVKNTISNKCKQFNKLKCVTYLHLLCLINTLLITADIIGIFHIEQFINITLLRRHIDHSVSGHVAKVRHLLAFSKGLWEIEFKRRCT